MDMSIILGPVIGSVIGYCTNYIAVKMLFRPLKPIKIGNYTLPFTPGIIPKGKDRLAKAVAEAVSNTLLTDEDIKNSLLTDEMLEIVSSQIINKDENIRKLLLNFIDEQKYNDSKTKIEGILTDEILKSILELEIGNIIAEKGKEVAKEKITGFIAMMLNDSLIDSILEPLGQTINEYIRENGEDYIFPIVCQKVDILEETSPNEILLSLNIFEEDMKNFVKKAYTNLIENKITDLLQKINIENLIEEKIKQMDVIEIENLVLQVMQKELNSIVNLGALIGFVIGILNIFI